MTKMWKQCAKGLALAGLAIGVGAGIAYGIDADDSYYSTGNAGSNLSGGDLAVIAGDGGEAGNLSVAGTVTIAGQTVTMAGGSVSTDDLLITRDWVFAGSDKLEFRAGFEGIYFEPVDGDNSAIINFEANSGGYSDDNDLISYVGQNGTDNDELLIAADEVVIEANSGDVVIHLGD